MKAVVITTINAPTPAVEGFSQLDDFELIVVGDRKTPIGWELPNAVFLGFEEQGSASGALGRLLPHDHYSRKMLGYVHAMECGATSIVDSDDDNLPMEGYRFPAGTGRFEATESDLGFINPYNLFTEQRIWPRGHPLDLISRDDSGLVLEEQKCDVAVWQGLADGEPDVDAIYRLTDNRPCTFRVRDPIVLRPGTIAPFNSQNTLVRQDAFPLLYLPAHVTFRFTDILRGLVAQPILWCYGLQLGFSSASVVQLRNPHDYFLDFLSEVPMYQYSRRVVEIVESAVSGSRTMVENLWLAYTELVKNGIVPESELPILESWIETLRGF